MLKIEIVCEPSELAQHLSALNGNLTNQPTAIFYPPPEPEDKPSRLARDANPAPTKEEIEAHIAVAEQPVAIAAKAEEPKAEAHEPTRRRGRPPKSETVHVDPPAPEPEKPLIASGEPVTLPVPVTATAKAGGRRAARRGSKGVQAH